MELSVNKAVNNFCGTRNKSASTTLRVRIRLQKSTKFVGNNTKKQMAWMRSSKEQFFTS